MHKKRVAEILVIPFAMILFVFTLISCSNGPVTFGSDQKDVANSIQKTADGGYIVAGYTWSFLSTQPTEFWIMKLDSELRKVWDRMYGGYKREYAYSIQQTVDENGVPDGYIIAGTSGSFLYDTNFWQLYILKIDLDGDVVWQKNFGGEDFEQANSIQQTSDGGYIVAGYTSSFGPGTIDDPQNPTHLYETKKNCWILKLNSDGELEWEKVYGGEEGDGANSIQQTSDGGYIVAGFSASHTEGVGNYDFWIMKLDTNGNNGSVDNTCNEGEVCWSKTFGGDNNELAKSVRQTTDGGYIVAGDTWSYGAGFTDFWVLKLDSDGNNGSTEYPCNDSEVCWAKAYGSTKFESAKSIVETTDGAYVVAGYTNSPELDAVSNEGWIVKINSEGDQIWANPYGGLNYDEINSITQSHDGGYIAAGTTDSFNYGVASQLDFWIVKIDSNGKEENSAFLDWSNVILKLFQ